MEFTYEDKVKAYNKYWSYIRGEEAQTNPNNGSNIEDLKLLVSMYKEGHLTKNNLNMKGINYIVKFFFIIYIWKKLRLI